MIQIQVVIDANVVQGELRWRLGRRRNPSARSSLHEALVSGVLVAIAPSFLESEIGDHEIEIAISTNSSIADVRREWKDFRKLLYFLSPELPSGEQDEIADPDDLPYVAASKELGLAVYSKDHHIAQMGAPVICISIDTRLRSYARATSVRIGFEIGSMYCVEISVEAIAAAYRLVEHGVSRFRRLDPILQIAIVGAAIIVVLHPKSRALLARVWRIVKSLASSTLGPVTMDLVMQYSEALNVIEANSNEIRQALPSARKRSLIMHARVVCLTARQPLSLSEIERRVRAQGYSSNSATFGNYLRGVLRSNRQFIEVAPGSWTFITMPHSR